MHETPHPRPPGPKPHFLIGNFPLGGPDPLSVFAEWAHRFGDIFYYRAGWIHVYFLNRPDYIESVLVTQHQNFIKDRVVRNSRWLFGDGLLTNEGAPWLRQRRLIQPVFHRDRIASYAEIMTRYTGEMLDTWKDGEPREIHQDMMHLTLRIVAKVLFSVEVTEETARIASVLNLLMRYGSGGKMVLPAFLRYLPIPSMLQVRRAVRHLDEMVYGIVRQHRASAIDNGDLLSMLLTAQDEDGSRMTDRQLRDEAMTFILAGHETTALSLSWIWFLLSDHPEAEQKLQRELRDVLEGRVPGMQDLMRLSYTEKVVKEAMRLYPPAWGLARTALSDCEIGGFKVPAGANVVMSQWVMHRDPRFYTHPEQFDPDRWSSESAQRLPRFAYFPFGGGPRLCIGASFAMMEATLLLATIAQRFQLRLVPGHPVVPVPSITLRPRHGIKAVVYRRR
jgi:cytochrome P450